MKKTYIEPKNTVVRLSSEQMVCQSAQYTDKAAITGPGAAITDIDVEGDGLAREVIDIPDAWEEW